jgi:hypothetical protein
MLFQLEQTSQDTLFENDLLEHSSSTPSLGSSFVDLVSEKAAIHTICDYAIQRWRTTFDRSEFIEKLKAYDEYFRNGGTVECPPLI